MEGHAKETAVIFLGGDLPSPNALVNVDPHVVIAADSGYAHAHGMGVEVHVLIGDLDSISMEHHTHAQVAGAQIVTAPRDKDQTDTELAIEWAVANGYEQLHLVYGGGDRFDHHLGAVQSLANPQLANVRVTAAIGEAFVHAIHGPSSITIAVDRDVSVGLVPVGGSAEGVVTEGLKWPLKGETLHAWSSRGVSNIAVSDSVTVRVERGVLFVIIHNEVAK